MHSGNGAYRVPPNEQGLKLNDLIAKERGKAARKQKRRNNVLDA